jgi:hypothetical protein
MFIELSLDRHDYTVRLHITVLANSIESVTEISIRAKATGESWSECRTLYGKNLNLVGMEELAELANILFHNEIMDFWEVNVRPEIEKRASATDRNLLGI